MKEMLGHIIRQMEEERGMDQAAAIADMRFAFIQQICEATVVKPHESKEHARSVKIDRLLTGKYTAIPAFIGIMGLVFWLTFGVIGAWLAALLDTGIGALTDLTDAGLTAYGINPVVHSLIINGIFEGVGSVLSFLPIIVTLFFFLSILEDSGYMARVAFVMDKLLRKIGLSGRSIVPMLIGFGCIGGARDGEPYLPRRARPQDDDSLTPVCELLGEAADLWFFSSVFPGKSALVMCALYLGGIVIGILVALLYRKTLFRGDAVPFVMELPNYRMPGAKNVGQLLWEKAKDFLERAFTVIFLATIVIWCLQTFDTRLNVVTDSQDSLLAMLAGVIAPVFAPLGFGDWRICTALLTGFMAKESVVATLTVLTDGISITSLLTPLAAAALLVFCLLYTPCVAAITSIKRELGGKWAALVVVLQCAIAWLCAFAVYTIGGLL